jgi:probable FeS assembly SUF system protein SufT
MQSTSSAELTRDCEATRIPVGDTIVLPANTPVDIVQNLGGSYTVRALDGLFRISSKDADALGASFAGPASGAVESPAQSTGAVDEQAVWDTLRTCYDPEIPVNIVDLGLIYDLRLERLASGNSRVEVKMTLTAPGCGMGAAIAGDAQQKLLALPGVEQADVQIVWDPPWHHSMISSTGRTALGLD